MKQELQDNVSFRDLTCTMMRGTLSHYTQHSTWLVPSTVVTKKTAPYNSLIT